MATRADGTVIIDITADPKQAINGINNVEKSVNGLASAAKKLTGILVAAFAVDKIVQFGKEAIELGSDVAEVQNVVDVAFGDMSYMVEDFADKAITSFGMSELAAKRTASTYMAMASNMGVTQQQAAEMAITLAGLTGDVASFYNISQELADIKLRSVFTGETETLKDLGIVMTQANLEAYALANGINRSFQSMSQSEQLILRYNYVLDQLSLASGDFVRTQDSWANQTRILSMQWQEFMSIIGQALIQVLRPVLSTLNSVVSSLISMANALNTALTSIFGGAQTEIQQTQNEVGGVAGGIDQAVDNQNALTDATKQTNKEQKKTLAGFDEINKLSGSSTGGSANSAGGTAGVLVGTPAPIPQTYTVDVKLSDQSSAILSFFNNLKAAIEPTTQAIGRLWEELKRVGSFAGDALTSFYNNFLVPVGTWVMGEGLPRFIDAMANGLALIDFQRINDSLNNLWDSLSPFAINVGEGLLWFWENVLVPLGTWVGNEIVPRFLDNLSTAIDILNQIIELAKPAFEWLWDTFLKPIAEFTGGMILAILDEFGGWLNIIAGILTGDFNRAVEGAKTIVQAWGDRFTLVKELAIAAWKGIKSVFSTVVNWFTETVITPFTSSFKTFINGMIGMVEGFVNFFIRGINKIISALNTISFSIPEWVPGIGGNSFGINIPSVSELKLPRLATGAVIPPNREFLAVLGDQKQGTNVETPLSTIEQAVANVMSRMGYGAEQTVILQVDKDQLGKVVYKLNKAESRRIGVNLAGV